LYRFSTYRVARTSRISCVSPLVFFLFFPLFLLHVDQEASVPRVLAACHRRLLGFFRIGIRLNPSFLSLFSVVSGPVGFPLLYETFVFVIFPILEVIFRFRLVAFEVFLILSLQVSSHFSQSPPKSISPSLLLVLICWCGTITMFFLDVFWTLLRSPLLPSPYTWKVFSGEY